MILARRIAGDAEAPEVVAQTAAWIERELGADYPWPGNVRELEQCVRSVLVRGEYRPAGIGPAADPDLARSLAAELESGALTADELIRRYCTHVYASTGSYEETGRRLDLDRRTVKAKIDAIPLPEVEPGWLDDV